MRNATVRAAVRALRNEVGGHSRLFMGIVERPFPTRCSRRRFSLRATGLLRDLTFARAVEKVSDGDSGRSNVASIDRKKIRAERLHPKTVYSHCQPEVVHRLRMAATKGQC